MAYIQKNNPFKKVKDNKGRKAEKHVSTKKPEERSEFEEFKMNPNAYISGAPRRLYNYFMGR
tara:strand:+ start:480 stop:665 length:186 start_codon:yes stop_codon:yes gene_type:complete